MKIAADKVEAFEEERNRFLKVMKKATVESYDMKKEEGQEIYQDLIHVSDILDLKGMKVTDKNKKNSVSIVDSETLLMAVGVYRSNIRNVFIKRYHDCPMPFMTLIKEHEETTASILGIETF